MAAEDRAVTLGLVLDGGRAQRMGGLDKGLITLAGRPLIAHAIERLLDDPAHAEASRRRGLERSRAFDWADTAARTLAFYHKVLGR